MRWFNKTLTIKSLIDIDPIRIKRSTNLSIELSNTYNIERKPSFFKSIIRMLGGTISTVYYKVFEYRVKSNSGNSYKVLIKVSPGFNKDQVLNNKIEVFCTCKDFMYRSAYNLDKTSNLYKIKATEKHLGEALTKAPTVVSTTPVCKHVYACIIHLINNINNLIIN